MGCLFGFLYTHSFTTEWSGIAEAMSATAVHGCFAGARCFAHTSRAPRTRDSQRHLMNYTHRVSCNLSFRMCRLVQSSHVGRERDIIMSLIVFLSVLR
jgi:hypothetical protein